MSYFIFRESLFVIIESKYFSKESCSNSGRTEVSGRSPDISCSIKFCLKIPQILKFPFTFPELITPKTVWEKSHSSSGLPCKEVDVPLVALESLCFPNDNVPSWSFGGGWSEPTVPTVPSYSTSAPLSTYPKPQHTHSTLTCCFISHCQDDSTLGRLLPFSPIGCFFHFFNPDPAPGPEHGGLGAGPCHTPLCALKWHLGSQ